MVISGETPVKPKGDVINMYTLTQINIKMAK